MSPQAEIVVHVPLPDGTDRPASAIGILVSRAEQERIDLMRRRSYELAIERGHVRR